MGIRAASFREWSPAQPLELARVLVVHDELASRLTLQTILKAGGYAVDVAGSAVEALARLDSSEYDLVLSDPHAGSQSGGAKILAYARVKEYRPATAMVTSYRTTEGAKRPRQSQIAIYTENIPTLLAKVAELIGMRASRRSERALRQLAAV